METDEILAKVLRALRGLRYGTLEIVVHDSKVVRMERRERIRLDVEGEDSLEQPQASNSPTNARPRSGGKTAIEQA